MHRTPSCRFVFGEISPLVPDRKCGRNDLDIKERDRQRYSSEYFLLGDTRYQKYQLVSIGHIIRLSTRFVTDRILKRETTEPARSLGVSRSSDPASQAFP